MPVPARVIIAFAKTDADHSAAASLAVGFERDGLPVERADGEAGTEKVLGIVREDDLLVVSTHLGADSKGEEGVALMRAVRAKLPQLPIVAIGDAEKRAAAGEAGATAFIAKPAFVKDVVTLGRVIAMPRDGIAPGWGGELDGLHLYYMVRALAAAKKTGVMTLTRANRRGELRFFEGEVTSAAAGVLHGQAAFHQLLLWPEASFDVRLESVVRRQQIPLTPAELLHDAEKFLKDFNELAGGISPASLYEQDPVKAAEHVDEIPKEVGPILRLFDGGRSVADVIEDSPARLAETMRVVARLVALGVVKKLTVPRPHRDAAAALQIGDWMVGQDAPQPAPVPAARKTPAAGHQAVEWPALGTSASQTPGAASYAPVVPSQTATGEIMAVGVAEPAKPEPAGATNVGRNGRSSAQVAAIPAEPKGRKSGTHGAVAESAKAEDKGRRSGPHAVPEEKGRKSGPHAVPEEKARKSGGHAAVGRASGSRRAVDKHFEDHEQAFFDQEHHLAHPPGDSFADLDEGKPQESFWKRLFGGAPKRRKVRKPGTRTAAKPVGKNKK
jgi:hypothetical protein